MRILPAIDLKDGKCVRLFKGDFSTVHQVSEDPVETAKIFEAAGAQLIHMVDLDGALDGKRKNGELVKRVAGSTTARIELGGGIRNMDDIRAADELGVWRFIIGSAAVSNPEFVAEAVKEYGERIAVGIDARNGYVSTHGWVKDSGISAIDFARQMEALGVKTIIFTDIDTDGTLQGPPIEKLKALREAVSCEIIASGGVAVLDDIKALRELGADGAIIGKAYYAGTIDLEEAVKEAGDQCWPKE
ncbi:MAG: 1-(5-phosphoribosyl)-5-[(5-phosphoribosylamino)methylideneamino]imidazole-4-carboxamide isomerase [Ruminococcaceae bacterium]|nr:1-(5-phosphoribosyl)-5-[(5-phosphoribosylamino)methylideneamino]imidazole-4-carboxamide isomerase [Oscillospiraceae bacterium]